MDKVNGSVIKETNGMMIESSMFTYSEEEKEKIIESNNNAELVWKPEFTCFYHDVQDLYDLSPIETLVYGFIRYFMNGGNKFYYSNEKLAKLFKISKESVTRIIKTLTEKNIIKTSYRINSTGGQQRFITSVFVPTRQNFIPTRQNDEGVSSNCLGGSRQNDEVLRSIKEEVFKKKEEHTTNNFNSIEECISSGMLRVYINQNVKDIKLRDYLNKEIGYMRSEPIHVLRAFVSSSIEEPPKFGQKTSVDDVYYPTLRSPSYEETVVTPINFKKIFKEVK